MGARLTIGPTGPTGPPLPTLPTGRRPRAVLARAARPLALASALALTGCQTVPPPGAAHPQVSAATAAWIDAFNACDAVRLAAMYAPTAMLWGTTAQTLISSPAGVRQYFDRACAMNPPPKAILVDQSVHVHGEFAVSAGRYTFVVSPGGQPRQLPARFSFTWRWVDGRWAIVEHHSSPLPPEPAPARPAGGS